MNITTTIWFWLLLLAVMTAFGGLAAQNTDDLSTGSRRARRAFERAEEAYHMVRYDEALESLERAIDLDDTFIEAFLLKAEIHMAREDYEKSVEPYRRVVSLDASFFPAARFNLGRALYLTGQYEEARQVLKRFLEMDGIGETMLDRGTAYLERSEFAMKAVSDPVPFEPQNAGPAINSRHSEYSPALTADEQTLIFTREQPLEDVSGRPSRHYYEDFYISHYRDGGWSEAENLGPPINTPDNEGAQSVTADGRQIYFTACNRPDGIGSCDIYHASREGGNWDRPINAGRPLNSASWDSQPSISVDGQTIYFASSREGSKGPMDIWKAEQAKDGSWKPPENLGDVINTEGSELSPFIHHDNETLYFASDGHLGLGGLDVFYSRRDQAGNWSEPVNIGYPVNTHGDEFGLIVTASGKAAWFSSDIEGGYGESDLYTFDLYEEARPRPVTYMKGYVRDAVNGEPLAADFELIDVEEGILLSAATSDPADGSFLAAIPTGRDIALNVSKEGYLFFSEHFSYAGETTAAEPYLRDIELQPVETGRPVVLRNIFFDHDSHRLKERSFPELEKLLHFMQNNPELHIEVSGHTDSTGTQEYNRQLSEKRARAVVDYLTNKGISPERITYKGYGNSRPIASDETPEGRARNRRTEFEVKEKKEMK
ncbi:MAG: OmpA family protein [Bacteroidales bacterium]